MAPSTQQIITQLEQYGSDGQRNWQHIVELGEVLIERGYFIKSRRDEAWILLEQIAVAAIACGKLDLANVCVDRLTVRFPKSPRVAILIGTLLEGQGLVEQAREFYEDLLLEDETCINIRKRLIALHLHSPVPSVPSSSKSSKAGAAATVSDSSSLGLSPIKGIELLVEYLDVVYNDVEGWAQLAASYAELGLYAQSLSALSHLLLLVPQNPFYLLRHAETAYTLGDIPLAYKEMLRVIEMSDGVQAEGGPGLRAAIGVKLCAARLGRSASTVSASKSETIQLKSVPAIDVLVTDLLLESYSSTIGSTGSKQMYDWMGIKYAGLEYGASTSCAMACAGDPTEACGGGNALEVYWTGGGGAATSSTTKRSMAHRLETRRDSGRRLIECPESYWPDRADPFIIKAGLAPRMIDWHTLLFLFPLIVVLCGNLSSSSSSTLSLHPPFLLTPSPRLVSPHHLLTQWPSSVKGHSRAAESGRSMAEEASKGCRTV